MNNWRIEKIAAAVGVLAIGATVVWTIATLVTKQDNIEEKVKELQAREPSVTKTAPNILSFKSAAPNDGSLEGYRLAFNSPVDGAMVPQYVKVNYSLAGKIPNGTNIILVVRDPLGQYWSWGKLKSEESVQVQLGVHRDKGATFQILLMVTNQDFPVNQPRQVLPEHVFLHSISVIRR